MPCDSSSERSTCPTPRLHPDFSIGSTRQAGGRSTSPTSTETASPRRPSAGWLRARHSPDGVVLYAKGCHPPNCLPELVPSEVDKARRLLGVERIDVFVLHRDDPSLPVAAFADALLEQVAAERIGGFGVSNWTVSRLRELQSVSRSESARTDSSSSATTSPSPRWWPSPGRAAWLSTSEELLALADTDLLDPRLVEPRDRLLRRARPGELGQPRQPSPARAGDRARRGARNLTGGGRARVRLAPARLRAPGRRHALRGPPRRGAVGLGDRVEPRTARVAGERRPRLRSLLLEKGGSQVASHLLRLVFAAALVAGAVAISGAAAAPQHALQPAAGVPDFGPNVKIFDPSMSTSEIQAAVDAIAAAAGREPVRHRSATRCSSSPAPTAPPTDPLNFQVGYYTEVAGLGALADRRRRSTARSTSTTSASAPDDCIALVNFWRSLSNLTINVAGQGPAASPASSGRRRRPRRCGGSTSTAT